MENSDNGEEFQEEVKQIIFKPRVMIRRSRIKLGSPRLSVQEIGKNSQFFRNSPEGSGKFFSVSPVGQRVEKNNFQKKVRENDCLFIGFEGNRIPLSSFGFYMSNHLLESSPLIKTSVVQPQIRISTTKKCDFRRLKWTPTHIRNQTYANPLELVQVEDKLDRKYHRANKPLRRELIPQTKAYVTIKSKQSIAELRISGTIKDFTLRDLQVKVKDSADVTDFEIPELYIN